MSAEFSRPQQVLMNAFLEDARPFIEDLKRLGWPVEVIALNQTSTLASEGVAVRLEVDLTYPPTREHAQEIRELERTYFDSTTESTDDVARRPDTL